MKAPFHYVFRFRQIRPDEKGEITFIENEKIFENEQPILAREQAFRYYQNYIDVLLESKGTKYLSDKQAREALRGFVPEKLVFNTPVRNYKPFEQAIVGIYLLQTVELPDLDLSQEYGFLDDPIHGIGLAWDLKPDDMIESLHDEFRLYEYLDFDAKNYQRMIQFFGATHYSDGPDLVTYKILETPFDWTGYDKPHEGHWDEEMESEKSDAETDEEFDVSASELYKKLIADGETKTVEFKASLLHSFVPSESGYLTKKKSAKTICAFLNTEGGYLFIGVNDRGGIDGLDYDYGMAKDQNPKDFFRREFDSLLQQFFSSVIRHKLATKFMRLNGKDVFIVTVFRADGPIFMKTKEGKEKTKEGKEFYIRGEALSLPLDMEDAYKYIRANSKWQDYNRDQG